MQTNTLPTLIIKPKKYPTPNKNGYKNNYDKNAEKQNTNVYVTLANHTSKLCNLVHCGTIKA